MDKHALFRLQARRLRNTAKLLHRYIVGYLCDATIGILLSIIEPVPERLREEKDQIG